MTTYTKADRAFLEDLIDKQALNPPANSFSREANDEADPGLESKLLKKCTDFLRRNHYKFIHDYSRAINERGYLDLYIFMPKRRLVVIELKAEKGRLSDEQKEWANYLLYHGYEVYRKVMSYKRFIEIIYG